MSTAAVLRHQIEAALANRIPSALTPAQKVVRPVAPTGVSAVDEVLEGGLPLGAITELVGPESSGRTSVALSFIASMTQGAKVCVWVDALNMLNPECATAAGVDLSRLLWVRCGVQKVIVAPQSVVNGFVLPEKYLIPPPIKKGLHGGGFGPHPRNEVKGLSEAISRLEHFPDWRRPELNPTRSFFPGKAAHSRSWIGHSNRGNALLRPGKEVFEPNSQQPLRQSERPALKPWLRIEQALRVTDLLLQAGGFSAIVLDMAGIAPEYVSRVPLATWFRYRAAAERTQAGILLLTQHPCAKSSGELLLRFQPGNARRDEDTVFTGIEHRLEVARRRFTQAPANVVPLRKPPQSVNTANWRSRTTWAGPR